MAAKILIRRIVPEDKEGDLLHLLKKLRSLTLRQPGYISGETLHRVDKPEEALVISTWHSIDDWERWFNSKERSEIQDKIDLLLGEETQYEIYEYD